MCFPETDIFQHFLVNFTEVQTFLCTWLCVRLGLFFLLEMSNLPWKISRESHSFSKTIQIGLIEWEVASNTSYRAARSHRHTQTVKDLCVFMESFY